MRPSADLVRSTLACAATDPFKTRVTSGHRSTSAPILPCSRPQLSSSQTESGWVRDCLGEMTVSSGRTVNREIDRPLFGAPPPANLIRSTLACAATDPFKTREPSGHRSALAPILACSRPQLSSSQTESGWVRDFLGEITVSSDRIVTSTGLCLVLSIIYTRESVSLSLSLRHRGWWSRPCW